MPLGFPLKSNKIGIIFLPTSNPSILPRKTFQGVVGVRSLGLFSSQKNRSMKSIWLDLMARGWLTFLPFVLRDLFHKTISYPRIPKNQPSIYERMYITYNFKCLFNAQKLGWNRKTPLIQLFFGMSLVGFDPPK